MDEQNKALDEFKAKVLTEMRELASEDDYEAAHIHADSLLCELLKYFGCDDIVDAFEKVGKWYA